MNPKGTLMIVGHEKLKVTKAGLTQGTLFVEIPAVVLESDNTKINIEVKRRC